MRSFVLALSVCLTCVTADAQTVVTTQTVTVLTAQRAAENMARRGVLTHCRNNGSQIEGIGFSTVSAEAAIRNCCFWGKRRPRDIGVARGQRGWFAVVWYE